MCSRNFQSIVILKAILVVKRLQPQSPCTLKIGKLVHDLLQKYRLLVIDSVRFVDQVCEFSYVQREVFWPKLDKLFKHVTIWQVNH